VAQAPGSILLDGKGSGGAVAMRAAVSPAANWVRLTADVKGIPTGENCRLLVITKSGKKEIAGSWIVGPKGEVTLQGSAAVAIGDVAAVAVENTAGREFVKVNV
jgi:RNA polymerase sigma-70 factor (ECF subfamily)